MAKLVVTEAQCRRGGALVEAVAPECILKKLALIIANRRAEVGGRGRRPARHVMNVCKLGNGGADLRRRTARSRCPGRMEGVELDFVDRTFGIFVAVNGTLDGIAQLAHLPGPMEGLQLRPRPRPKTRPVGTGQLDCHSTPEKLGEQPKLGVPSAQRPS